MQKRTWILSDSHWFHKNVAEFSKRPYNWQEKTIKQWKNCVKDTDTIIHLGDVCFGNKQNLLDVMRCLPGTKILVKGNHDRFSNSAYIEAGFSVVVHSLIYELNVFNKKSYIILSHKPTRLLLEENWYNIHGHFHNCLQENWEPELRSRITDKHYLFSLEYMNYKPILLNETIDRSILPLTKKCGLKEVKNEI